MRSYAIASLALLAAYAPSFAAGTRSGAGCPARDPSSGAIRLEGPAPLPTGHGDMVGYQPLAPIVCYPAPDDRSLLVRTCGLETLNAPELVLPAARPLRLPSLGGPTLTLTSPDALPALRDEARHDDQEDTLRLLRSNW
jgi:hypothetical protein